MNDIFNLLSKIKTCSDDELPGLTIKLCSKMGNLLNNKILTGAYGWKFKNEWSSVNRKIKTKNK